jgi:hypothetical protein
MIGKALLLIASVVLPADTLAQAHAPEVLVEHGACPFECCRYGAWTTLRNVAAFRAPAANSPAGTIPAGTSVIALTGYVRTVGTPFAVTRAHPPYRPGDTLMVYTYHGEGMFSVWHDGKRFTEDLGFSPYGGSAGRRCTDRKQCWGVLQNALRSDWWAQVRLHDGRVVWVRGDDGFDGQDACN